ncbi:hypothetical protein JCGZ_24240 [Jatropha curcas]|uniref:Uncharacterized protein n=1 Tax=Jatropha curcas TaxID=180498 RepID=A0A067LGM7_JATCU|nr:hypothetical protein JCGZ_24240 [Jatropha curcas]
MELGKVFKDSRRGFVGKVTNIGIEGAMAGETGVGAGMVKSDSGEIGQVRGTVAGMEGTVVNIGTFMGREPIKSD